MVASSAVAPTPKPNDAMAGLASRVAARNGDDSLSVELSLEQVLKVAELIGFVREGNVEMRPCPYTANPKGMARMLYTCAFFTMIKPA